MNLQKDGGAAPVALEDATVLHSELSALLNNQDVGANWYGFMTLILSHIPTTDVGRPSREAIENSFLGVLGFKSFKAYVDTRLDQGGLGWSMSKWYAWREAYRIACEHRWVVHARFKPDQIRALNRKYPDRWPETLSEHLKNQAENKTKHQTETNDVTEKFRCDDVTCDVEGRLGGPYETITMLENKLKKAESENQELRQELKETASELSKIKIENRRLKRFKRKYDDINSRGFFQRLIAVFNF